MEEPKLTEHALQAEPKPTAPDTHSNNQNRPIASDVPETRPKIKHPVVLEKNWQNAILWHVKQKKQAKTVKQETP